MNELKSLNFLIGKWSTKGEVRATSSTPAIKINGTDTYEWTLDGQFILHRVEVMMGNEKKEAVEFIGGYEEARKAFFMRSFDNDGNFTVMNTHINKEGVMELNGDKMRSRLSVKDGNQMVAHWEMSEDGKNWSPWMDLTLTK